MAKNRHTNGTTLTVTVRYPCNLPSSSIAPYIYINGAWTAITPFTVNSSACTVTFSVPGDPVVGVFQIPAARTTTVLPTTIATTIAPTTIVTPPVTPPSNATLYAAIVIIIVIVIIIAVWLYLRTRRKR